MKKNENKILGIYIPSYHRFDTTMDKTYRLLEYGTYVVRKSEEESYRNAGVENIWAIEDSEIDNAVKVVNYIIDHAPEQMIAMIDDDVEALLYRMDTTEKVTDPYVVTSEIERIAQLMLDLGIGYGATDSSPTPWNYNSEFEFKGTSGGLRWFNKKVYKSKFREKVYHNCDLDVVLHELLINRIILKPKYLVLKAGTDTNSGGNSSKTRKAQEDCARLMKQEWGKYFDYDFKSNKPYIRVKR